jgi:beta-lactamase class A
MRHWANVREADIREAHRRDFEHQMSRYKKMLLILLAIVGIWNTAAGASTQALTNLRDEIREIGAKAQGKVGVACSVPGVALDCELNPDQRSPMQSVFKVPLAMTVFHRIEKGRLKLDQPIQFLPVDRILPYTYSALQQRYPDANVAVPIHELLELAVVSSDNVAADVLLRSLGGPAAVTSYMKSLGVNDFQLVDGEHALHRNHFAQYRNWCTPRAAVHLLRILSDRPPISNEHRELLLEWMERSVKPRLAQMLPTGVAVAHKAGTSGVDLGGAAPATNDIGLISLPDGRKLALAIFVTDAKAELAVRETIISEIAKRVYDAALATPERESDTTGLQQFARTKLQEEGAVGFIHVRNVASRHVLIHVTNPTTRNSENPTLNIDTPLPPLSVIKVHIAAIWLRRGYRDTVVDCAANARWPIRHMRVEEVLSSGCDSAGAQMAILLRRKFGAKAILKDLRRLGLNITLEPRASDDEWGKVLSIGEEKVQASPRQISAFLTAIARDDSKLLPSSASKLLRAALEDVVKNGTAESIKGAMSSPEWTIGGKTATGPGACGDHCDGWFAAILSSRQSGKYVILSFVRGKGLGSGVAAHNVAAVANYLIQNESSNR